MNPHGPIRCVGCGCLLQRHQEDDPRVPRRCRDCWHRTPESIIVAEQRGYEHATSEEIWRRG